jgi:hypothetical protein
MMPEINPRKVASFIQPEETKKKLKTPRHNASFLFIDPDYNKRKVV